MRNVVGTGVILATAFVHMLPDALENFSSPCLTQGWLSYGAFAGIFCMISSFALQLLEVVSVSHMNKMRRRNREKIEAELGNNHDYTDKVPIENGSQFSKHTAVSTANVMEERHEHHHHIGDSHGHVHGAFLEEDEAYKHIGTYILELGIVMHSILIGITLSTTENSEFTTLLIALVFHQVRRKKKFLVFLLAVLTSTIYHISFSKVWL